VGAQVHGANCDNNMIAGMFLLRSDRGLEDCADETRARDARTRMAASPRGFLVDFPCAQNGAKSGQNGRDP